VVAVVDTERQVVAEVLVVLVVAELEQVVVVKVEMDQITLAVVAVVAEDQVVTTLTVDQV
jgi:hypothetical protein